MKANTYSYELWDKVKTTTTMGIKRGNSYNKLDTAINSALEAEVTAMLKRNTCQEGLSPPRKRCVTNNTTSSMATAPPFPIRTVAAAGAANPALVCDADSGSGYVGKRGYDKRFRVISRHRIDR